MSASKKSGFWSVAAKWAVVVLAVATMFAYPVLGAITAAVMAVAWACGRKTALCGAGTAAYPLTEAAVQTSADTASPTRHEVMRSWLLLF